MHTRHLAALTLFTAVGSTALVACGSHGDEDSSQDQAIIGGTEAKPGSFPGMAMLNTAGYPIYCGGTLVADEWVLTAGHCADTSEGGSLLDAVIDRHSLTTTDGESIPIASSILHPNYRLATAQRYGSDIALLKLSRKAKAHPVKLLGTAQRERTGGGTPVTVAGWGTTTATGDHPSQRLLFAELVVVANESCYQGVASNLLCAGSRQPNVDSCTGDSGGPLFATVDGEVVQVGIVSFGNGCGVVGQPGVYTRVTDFLGWIHDQTDGAAGEAVKDPDPPSPAPAGVPSSKGSTRGPGGEPPP